MTKAVPRGIIRRDTYIVNKSAKDIFKISFATLNSRILGLVRDSATMAYLGIGAVSSAYTFAFTFPNLFRRLLGEGALTSAMIPVFSQALKEGGKEAAFDFLNKVLSRAGAVLAATVAFFCVLCLLAGTFASGQERFILGAQFSVLMMPYMLLICLAAIFSAGLNVLGSFGVPSVGPAALNLAIIASLFAGVAVFGTDMESLAWCMCGGWLLGGCAQLLIPAAYMRKKGWRFRFDFGNCGHLSNLYRLFLPACLGAAVIQVNILVSKLLALFVNDAALPALYLSSRLVELPLGVFTVAVATVYFPKLSMLNSENRECEYKRSYARGFVMTMCITVPAAAGLAFLGRDILGVLFEWGVFGGRDVNLCLPVLMVSAAALPFYGMSTFATRGFHSSKNMKTPLKVSCVVIVVNLAVSLLLMFRLGAVGLAAANTAAAAVQAFLLEYRLKRQFGGFEVAPEIFKILAATAVMVASIFPLRMLLGLFFEGKMLALAVCVAVIPLAAALYFASLYALKFKQIGELVSLVERRI